MGEEGLENLLDTFPPFGLVEVPHQLDGRT